MPPIPQVVVSGDWEAGHVYEPGLNRSFDMTKILNSHFGDVKVASSDDDAAVTGATTTTAPQSPAATVAFTSPGGAVTPGTAKPLLPLCVFTCYWGIDETPVVVGLRMAGGRGQSPGGVNKGGNVGKPAPKADSVPEALQKQIRQLKVTRVSVAGRCMCGHCLLCTDVV